MARFTHQRRAHRIRIFQSGPDGLRNSPARLVATYEIGRLTPFIGAGMSRLACSDWPGLVHSLEEAVAGHDTPVILTGTDPAEMIRRGNTAVRSLKSRDRDTFIKAMSTALVDRGGDIPPQTRALARIWWPLVVTTNYDNYYTAAFRERPESRLFAVVGRNPEDCQRVLSSLSSAGRALLWALQGYLDQPCKVQDVQPRPDLIDQLVVGHDAVTACHLSRAALPPGLRRSVSPTLVVVPRLGDSRNLSAGAVRRSARARTVRARDRTTRSFPKVKSIRSSCWHASRSSSSNTRRVSTG